MVESPSTQPSSSEAGDSSPSILKYPNGRFPLAKAEGGLILDDSENSVTKVIKDMMWKAGKNILSGQFSDLMKMGTPAYIHQEKSYLHMVTKDMNYYEHYMREAMKHPEDPVWKLKNIVMAILSKLHQNAAGGSKSPLNPILGETLVEQSLAGTMMYCE